MNNYMKTIISGLQSYIHSYTKKARGNWNQNNPDAIDYIKNRPFYSKTENVVLFERSSITNFDYENENIVVIRGNGNINFLPNIEYSINCNGNNYTCKLQSRIVEGGQINCIGDFGLLQYGEITNNDFPFAFLYVPEDNLWVLAFVRTDVETYSFKITGPKETIVKVPEKYLPPSKNSNILNGAGEGAVKTKYASEALGHYSFAEGDRTIASGACSHAEGCCTTASKESAHAEGHSTTASGSYSHAEGGGAVASGNYSHAEGRWTIASGEAQHVQGKWNIKDTENKYAHIVGNGSSQDQRSNAHTLDWEGNAWFAGDVYIGGDSMDSAIKLGEGSKPNLTRVTLLANSWSQDTLTQSITITGISADQSTQIIQIILPEDNELSNEEFELCDVSAIDQQENTIIFKCETIPSNNIEVYIKWQDCNYFEHHELLPFDINTLIDFYYTYDANKDTYTITGWKGTTNGVPGTEILIPNDRRIIL